MLKNIIFILLFTLITGLFACHAEEHDRGGALEMRVFTMQYADVREMLPIAEQMKSPEGKVSMHEATGSLIVYDIPEVLDNIDSIVLQLDIPASQVEVKVIMVETSGSFLKNAGITAENTVIPAARFGEIRHLMNGRSDVTVRSEMSLRTISGRPAALRVRAREIYPGDVFNAEGVTVIRQEREREAGDYLEILPRVNRDGTVTVTIMPTVSEFTGPGTTRERSVLTRVIIEDGDTIVLGGVDRSEEQTVFGGIPHAGTGSSAVLKSYRYTLLFLTVAIVD